MFALRPWHLLTRARYKHWLFTKTLGCCTVMLAELGRFSVGIIDGEPYWGGASFTLGYIFDFSIFLHWTRLDCSTVASLRCFRLGRLLRLLLAVELESRTPYNVCRYLRTVVCVCVCVFRGVRACVFLSIEIRSCCYTVVTHEEHVCLSMYCSCLRVCVCRRAHWLVCVYVFWVMLPMLSGEESTIWRSLHLKPAIRMTQFRRNVITVSL